MPLCTRLLHFSFREIASRQSTSICKSAKRAVVNFAKTVCSSLTQGLELNKREVTEDLAYYAGLKYLSYIYWVEIERAI